MIEISYIDLDDGEGTNRSFETIREFHKFLEEKSVLIYSMIEYEKEVE